MNDIPTSEVLNRAADLIEERGWIQGGNGWDERAGGPLCLEGGILGALGETFLSVDLDAFWTCPAYAAVQMHLGLSCDLIQAGSGSRPVDPLWKWNDRKATAERVIEVLRACAVIEASREREAAEVAS